MWLITATIALGSMRLAPALNKTGKQTSPLAGNCSTKLQNIGLSYNAVFYCLCLHADALRVWAGVYCRAVTGLCRLLSTWIMHRIHTISINLLLLAPWLVESFLLLISVSIRRKKTMYLITEPVKNVCATCSTHHE